MVSLPKLIPGQADPQETYSYPKISVAQVRTGRLPGNPIYFELMSKLLAEIIKQRRNQALSYREYLHKIIELAKQVRKPESSHRYSPRLDTPAKRAFYDNLGSDEGLAVSLDEIIRRTKKADWRGDLIKEREVKRAIRSLVNDPDLVEKIFDLAKNQQEY